MTEATSAPTITIGTRRVGRGESTLVIAELSANHGQDLGRALELVDASADAGVDAIKLQTYTPDTMTLRSDREPFRVGDGTPWAGRRLYDLYAEAQTPWGWHDELKARAEGHGLVFLSTPFDASAVRFLADLDLAVYKVASFELVDLELIRLVAATGRPVILSTGMASVSDIDLAVRTARESGAGELALLRCNSAYPAPPSEMDLATIPHMASTWGVPIGLSDHSLGTTAAAIAVAFGASIVEKHITLSRDDPSPDSAFSLEPAEFRELVDAVRVAEQAVGGVRYGPSPHEEASLAFRRSLFVVVDLERGDPFTPANIRSIRPAGGLEPRHLRVVLGRRAACDIPAGTPLQWTHVGS